MIRAFALVALLVLVACNRDKPNVTAEDASAPAPFAGIVVDVSGEGDPKITGSGPIAEIRGTAMTPWKRAITGADQAKMRGAKSMVFVAGDKRAKQIDLPKATTGDLAMEMEIVSIDRSGALTINGAPVGSVADVGRSLAGGPQSRRVIVTAHESVELGKVIEVIVTIQPLGRPIALSIEK